MTEMGDQGLGPGSEGGGFFSTLPRLIAAVATLLGVIGGFFGITAWGGPQTPTDTESKPVTFVIKDPLGQGQLGEVVDVKIDGKSVGQLEVDANNRTEQLSPSMDEGEGKYEYSLSSVSLVQGPSGRPVEIRGSGQGTINVKQGKTFVVCGDVIGTTMKLTLVQNSC